MPYFQCKLSYGTLYALPVRTELFYFFLIASGGWLGRISPKSMSDIQEASSGMYAQYKGYAASQFSHFQTELIKFLTVSMVL